MAKQLIDGMTSDWDPERYSDTYTDELRKRIKAKESGKEVVESGREADGESPRPHGGTRS